MTTGSGPERVELRLLGPVEALVDGVPVTLGGSRPRGLVTVLALSAGKAVSVDRLIDAVWDGDPPTGAANSVQVYVSRLRRTLQPADGQRVLRSSPGGYLLDVPPDAVDVLRFERLASEGNDRLRAGHPASAARLLDAALALWRGPALSDLDGPSTHGIVMRLEARRLATRMDRMDVEIALGRHAQAVPELQELVDTHPLDEGLVARLMTALYLSGRQGDALAAYAAAARRLADDLGVDPSPSLRAVHSEVLRQSLTMPRTVAATEFSAHASSALEPGGGAPAGQEPTAPAAPAVEGGARARALETFLRPRGDLIGRRAEMESAVALLQDPAVRIVTLLGPGGMGKTRLAVAIADALRAVSGAAAAEGRSEREPLRVAVVPLSTVTDDGEVLASVAQVLGATSEWAGQDILEMVARELEGRRTVLVLDNLEQLVDSEATLDDILALLDRLPLLSLLCTSRTALRLAQEHQIPIGPLSVPGPDDDLDAILASDAVQLFRERSSAVVPGFTVTADNARAVADVCRLLEGQPLALELAAARSRVLQPDDMVRRTGRLLQLLTGGGRDLPARQRSIRAALDWSAQLLDEAEESVFAQLSVFAGGWTVDAAEAVCDRGRGRARGDEPAGRQEPRRGRRRRPALDAGDGAGVRRGAAGRAGAAAQPGRLAAGPARAVLRRDGGGARPALPDLAGLHDPRAAGRRGQQPRRRAGARRRDRRRADPRAADRRAARLLVLLRPDRAGPPLAARRRGGADLPFDLRARLLLSAGNARVRRGRPGAVGARLRRRARHGPRARTTTCWSRGP